MRSCVPAVAALVLSLQGGVGVAKPMAALAVKDPVIRPAPAGLPTTAAYLTLFNATSRPLTLTTVSCGCAASVSAHESRMVGAMMDMRSAGPLAVPPHGILRLQPGGLHLMVMGLKHPIKVGDTIPMRLSFAGMAPITVRFTAAR